MPGGLMPPVSVWLAWPTPNYTNPVKQPQYVLVISCIIAPISIALLFARLWVRIRVQRNTGWDDWLMLMALFPVTAMTVLIVLVTEKYHMNRHVWDIEFHYFPLQRKINMAIYVLFALSSGLIKMSILFFYRRLSSRAVSPAFRWLLRLTIASIAIYTVFFTIVPFFMCRPMAAFWEQTDFAKLAMGYKFKCSINEGIDVLANGVIATIQDLIAAILPTLLCWNLQISFREKVALYSIFTISYSTVIIGAMRTWAGYRLFFVTYDVTWVANELWLWCLLELHIGCMCANAPALKVFFSHALGTQQWTTGSRSKSRTAGSRPTDTNRTNQTMSTIGARSITWEKLSSWRRNIIPKRNGYMSEPHSNITTDKCGGIVQTSSHHVSIEEERDVEMGSIQSTSFGNVSDVQALPPIATPKLSRWPLGRTNSPSSQWTDDSGRDQSVWRFWKRKRAL